MPLKVAKRGQVPPFIVMDVMSAAAEREATHGDVLHLEVGQPATAAPRGVIEAARHALETEKIGYTVALGIPPLRRRIAEHYRERYGLGLSADRIVVTTGSSAGFLLSFLAAFEPGDRVALAAPGYPAYRNILRALDIVPVEIPTGPETRYQPTPALVDALSPRPDGLIVASPANPTGTMLGVSENGGAFALTARMPESGWSPTRSTTTSPMGTSRRRRQPMASTRSSSTASRNTIR